jgi:alpha/beta superfamily hydrolase
VTEALPIPGSRDVPASLDSAGDSDTADTAGETDSVVVACPPHPQMRGDRHDGRLTAVSDCLTAAGVDCLRFDYGPWDEGYGEQTDAENAVSWATDRYDRVALFGFSFGGAIALLTAASDGGDSLNAVSALAPAARLTEDLDAAAALDSITVPVQVVYGERDDTAEWEPVVERARELDYLVEGLPADHFFVGQQDKAADRVCAFLTDQL